LGRLTKTNRSWATIPRGPGITPTSAGRASSRDCDWNAPLDSLFCQKREAFVLVTLEGMSAKKRPSPSAFR